MLINSQTKKVYQAHYGVRQDFPEVSLPAELTNEVLADIGVFPLIGSEPEYDPISQSITEQEAIEVAGAWTRQWLVEALPQEQAEANLTAATERAWERIKHERDRRKFAGVKVGTDWFHCDTDSRGQWERMVNRVNTQGLVDSAGYTIGGQPVPWKTMTGSFVILTAGKIRAVVDAVELQEAMIFGRAEMHRVAMEASSTPESYDFSTGWPVSIEDAP